MSDLTVRDADYGIVFVEARGGSRRQRGATITAYVRGKSLKRIDHRPVYSETYGFNTLTRIRYQKV